MNPANSPRAAGARPVGSIPETLINNRTLLLRRALLRTLLVVLPCVLLTLPLLRHPAASAALLADASCDLDPTFGNAGKVTTTFPGGLDTPNDVAVQTDGKIVVAGSSGSDFALARYNTDGSLDNSFDAVGRVTTDFAGVTFEEAHAVALQADGKIVAPQPGQF